MPDEIENTAEAVNDKKKIKEERKKLRAEQKQQKKEAKKRAKELASQEAELDDDGGGGIPVVLVTLLIVLIWVAILCVLIKLDVGGFGSNVLRPVLQNVPVVNKILPSGGMTQEKPETEEEDEYYGYKSLKEAVDQIKVLELELEKAQSSSQTGAEELEQLRAEVERLKTFEDKQVEFERIKNEFYDEVVYAEKGPGAEAYKKYYESIDPANAEALYKQVIQQLEEDQEIQDYAKAYAAMKPAAAAGIFEAMTDNLDLASEILGAMTPDERGKVLGAMNPEVAAKITKIMDPK